MIKALLKGFWRVVASPGLIIWLWLVNFIIALPLAWVMTSSLSSSIGGSLVDENLTESFDMGWYGEFEAGAKGLETTFSPTVVGMGAFYNNLEAWLYGDLFDMSPGLVGLGVLFILIWALLLGGVLDRYSGSDGMFNLSRFFSNGGKFFFRFVRLAILSGVLYYLIYRLAGWLFTWVEAATLDVTVERTVFLYTVLVAVAVAFLLTLVNMSFDYAKIITFKENRRSMLLASLRGIGFVFRHPFKAMGLYYTLVVLGALLLGIYASVAPGANQSTTTAVIWAFVVGQVALLVKLMLRLWFYAGQMALFESVAAASAKAAEASGGSGSQ
jgi:hypothetical protein